MASVPEKVVLHVVSPLGPLAARTGTVETPTIDVPVFNQTGKPLVLRDVRITGPWRADTGASVPAALTGEVDSVPRTLKPGETGQVHLSGAVAAQPALYKASLQIGVATGDPIVLPMEIGVEAHWMWGFALLLAGLLTVAGLNTLDREQKVQASRKQLLEKQRAAEAVALDIPLQSLFAQRLAAMRAEYGKAVEALARPNWLSVVDHRLDDSDKHTKVADDQLAQIQQSWESAPSTGGPLAAAVEEQLAGLKARIDAIRARFSTAPPAGEALGDRLAAFDSWAGWRLTGAYDMTWRDLAADLERLRLLNAAGRTPDARASAVALSRRARRTAGFIGDSLTLLDKFATLSRADLAREARLRTRLRYPALSDADRARLVGGLDQGIARFAAPFAWPMRREVSRALQAIEVDSLRALMAAISAQTAAIRAATEDESYFLPPAVLAVNNEGALIRKRPDGKADPDSKFAWLAKVAQVWRQEITQLPAPAPILVQSLAALDTAIGARDIDAVSTAMKTIMDTWSDMRGDEATGQINAAVAILCVEQRAAMLDELSATEDKLRFLAASAKVPDWESAIAAFRAQIDDLVDETALKARAIALLGDLTRLSERIHQLDAEIDGVVWNTDSQPKATGLWLASERGAEGSSAQDLRDYLSDYRDLTVTPAVGRHGAPEAGDEVVFTIGNLDAGWQEGVNLTVNFGDGPPQTMTVEAYRQGGRFAHTYPRPGSYVVTVAARTAAPAASDRENPSIGGVRQPLVVGLSEVTRAGQVAGALLNVRFLLTLVIAAVIYFWAWYARFTAFGASPFDYVQAFALGFSVSLAVNKLPEALARFAPVG
jgi:hypothetical protein